MKRLLTLLTAIIAIAVSAQTTLDSIPVLQSISTKRNISIQQPQGLARRLMAKTPSADTASPAVATGGYRIQLFSGNNPRTAKSQAESRAAQVAEIYPEWAAYITFDAPYWRLKVGDFSRYEDATAALSSLKAQFPSFAREMRVVRDRIKSAE